MTTGLIKALALLAAGLAATAAPAQDWTPSGPVTMKIGFRAGGGADTLGRLLAQELAERRGWEVIPQNVDGRGGLALAMDGRRTAGGRAGHRYIHHQHLQLRPAGQPGRNHPG